MDFEDEVGFTGGEEERLEATLGFTGEVQVDDASVGFTGDDQALEEEDLTGFTGDDTGEDQVLEEDAAVVLTGEEETSLLDDHP